MALANLAEWEPLTVPEVAALFVHCKARWWIAGGWAIDLLLGYQSRSHTDTDILLLRRDQHSVRQQLRAWDLWAADPPGTLRPWTLGETLPQHVHDIWCRRSPSEAWSLQLMLDDDDTDDWLFRRDHRVRRSVRSLSGPASTPERAVLTPAVQLLYKSRELRSKDEQDFTLTLPVLASSERIWLAEALSIASPEHPWINRLSDEAQ